MFSAFVSKAPPGCKHDALADSVDWIFVSGSGMLGLSIGLNAVSTHGTCTAVFLAVAFIIGFVLSSIRTLGRITWIAWVGLVCILTSSKFTSLELSRPQLTKQSSSSPSPSASKTVPPLRPRQRKHSSGSRITKSSTTRPSHPPSRQFQRSRSPLPVHRLSSLLCLRCGSHGTIPRLCLSARVALRLSMSLLASSCTITAGHMLRRQS